MNNINESENLGSFSPEFQKEIEKELDPIFKDLGMISPKVLANKSGKWLFDDNTYWIVKAKVFEVMHSRKRVAVFFDQKDAQACVDLLMATETGAIGSSRVVNIRKVDEEFLPENFQSYASKRRIKLDFEDLSKRAKEDLENL